MIAFWKLDLLGSSVRNLEGQPGMAPGMAPGMGSGMGSGTRATVSERLCAAAFPASGNHPMTKEDSASFMLSFLRRKEIWPLNTVKRGLEGQTGKPIMTT